MYKNVVNGNCGRPIGPARVAIGRPIGHDARDDDFVTMVSDEERPSFISPLALTKLSCNPEVLAELLNISRQNFDGTQIFAVAFLVQENVRSTAFIHLRGRDRHCYAKCFHGFQRLMRQRPLTPNTCKSPTRWSRPRCGPMLIPRQDTARHPHPPPDRARSRAG